jgi:hypothetical protein
MRELSLYEKFAKGLADAIADIREKVVEEPWFGRVVNERDAAMPHWPQAQDVQPEQGGHDQERDAADKGIDR